MQLKQPTKRNQSGFSVIEVLFVVLVVAVLAIILFRLSAPTMVKPLYTPKAEQVPNAFLFWYTM
ncbi:MAG: prepilin-type N-terminal cleavage/methylation domain-containing protein [Ktedonobacteraceae bacterium]